MKAPKMMMFDYGQTLGNEAGFDGIAGVRATMQYAVANKHNLTPEQVWAYAEKILKELDRDDPKRWHLQQTEIPDSMFKPYLFASLGIKFDRPQRELDVVFWDAASPVKPTEGIKDFLKFLREHDIRTGVVSNLTYCGAALERRLRTLFPEHEFEFMIATSEFLFRKPNKHIFDLALEMADLQPNEVWFAGDSYECDVIGSRGAGMHPIWYIGATENPEEKEDVLTITHWRQLQALMEV